MTWSIPGQIGPKYAKVSKWGNSRPHGGKVACLVSHQSSGSSELGINLVIQIILAC